MYTYTYIHTHTTTHGIDLRRCCLPFPLNQGVFFEALSLSLLGPYRKTNAPPGAESGLGMGDEVRCTEGEGGEERGKEGERGRWHDIPSIKAVRRRRDVM